MDTTVLSSCVTMSSTDMTTVPRDNAPHGLNLGDLRHLPPAWAGRGVCTGGTSEFDDDRLTGDYEMTQTIASGFETGVQGEIVTEEFRITNVEGAWSGQAIYGVYSRMKASRSSRVTTGC